MLENLDTELAEGSIDPEVARLQNEIWHLKMRTRDYAKQNIALVQQQKDVEKTLFHQREANRKLDEAHKKALKRISDLEAILAFKNKSEQ
jgi:hypothetical protein